MALRDFSKPGSWTSRLYDILRPAPHPLAAQFSNSQSRFRHSTGEIWRHALSCSVYHDLAGEMNDNIARTKGASRRTWRRFVRMECIGLSGLLFYEIRTPDFPNSRVHERRALTGTGQREYDLTVENVFGDPHDPSDVGMEVDDLLDAVHAKVIYFPAYACTSFIVGHAMTAFFRDQPSFRPRPAREGFSVPCSETMEQVPSLSGPDKSSAKESQRISPAELEPILLPSYSWKAIRGELGVLDRFTLEPDDPHVPLCVRSSILPDVKLSCYDLSDDEDDKEDGNTTSSTIDSVGPPTPPRSTRSEAQDARDKFPFTSIDHPLSGRLLPRNEDDRSIGLNLLTQSKPLLKPSVSLPKFISGSGVCVSVYHELASFLDLSISHVEVGRWIDRENKENYSELPTS